MKALVFPGQGAQFQGMGLDLYTDNMEAKSLFDQADEILGYKLSAVMFDGSDEDLKQTNITQPALFVHALAKLKTIEKGTEFEAVAGHSLGEFSALVAAEALTFEDGLKLVYERAMAMQAACDISPGTMAAVLGLEDKIVEEVCASIDEVVVAANYNCPGQLVISGSTRGIELAVEALKAAGAKRALILPVGGAFHSPLMEVAKERLAAAIEQTNITTPKCAIYQNVVAAPVFDPSEIKINLINQLTGSVKWTQSIQKMIGDGVTEFIEVGGSGKVLSGLIFKINRDVTANSL